MDNHITRYIQALSNMCKHKHYFLPSKEAVLTNTHAYNLN
uniref:Uncharacterized protein n=1 Tax=Rhizophora mucronata TaxID=61149 RepID=A0A2P2NF06_RHIMU